MNIWRLRILETHFQAILDDVLFLSYLCKINITTVPCPEDDKLSDLNGENKHRSTSSIKHDHRMLLQFSIFHFILFLWFNLIKTAERNGMEVKFQIPYADWALG